MIHMADRVLIAHLRRQIDECRKPENGMTQEQNESLIQNSLKLIEELEYLNVSGSNPRRGRPSKPSDSKFLKIAISVSPSAFKWLVSKGKPSQVIRRLIEAQVCGYPSEKDSSH